MTSVSRLLGALAAAVLAFAFTCLAAAANPPLVLGSYAYPGLDRVAAMKPLAGAVARTTGQPVEIRLYEDPDRLAAAIKGGEVDVAVANLGAWLKVVGDPAVQPLAVIEPPAALRRSYRAVLLARHDLDVADLSAASARAGQLRLAAVMPGSASGGLVQSRALAQANGAEPQWRSVSFHGSHEGALAALANGMADLAAVAEAPWLAWQAAQSRPAGAAELPRVLWQSAPLPSGALVCRASPRIDCTALSRALLRTTPEARRAAEFLGRGWPEWAGAQGFARYDRALYASLGLGGDAPPAGQ